MRRSDARKQDEDESQWKARVERNRIQRAWQAKHPGYNAEGRRDRHFKAKYGASTAQIEEQSLLQGHACAICGAPQGPRLRRGGSLHFDHNHETGQHRAMLCPKCNGVVAPLEDEQWRIDQATLYLRSYD